MHATISDQESRLWNISNYPTKKNQLKIPGIHPPKVKSHELGGYELSSRECPMNMNI